MTTIAQRVVARFICAASYELEGLSPEEFTDIKGRLKSALKFPFSLRYHKSVNSYGMAEILPTAGQSHRFTEEQVTEILTWLLQHGYEDKTIPLATKLRDPWRWVGGSITFLKKV